MDTPSSSPAGSIKAPGSVSVVVSAPVPVPVPTGAPPEPVAVDLVAVKNAFASGPAARLLDLSGRFTLDERAKVQRAAEELAQKTGGKVWILALPGKTDVTAFAPVHKDLKLGTKDVYFIFNGEKRHLQTVSKSVGNDVLKSTNKDFYKSQSDGTVKMLDELGRVLTGATPVSSSTTASTAATTPVKTANKSSGGELLLVPVAVAAIAWLLLKTRKPQPTAAKPKSAKPKSVRPPEIVEATDSKEIEKSQSTVTASETAEKAADAGEPAKPEQPSAD